MTRATTTILALCALLCCAALPAQTINFNGETLVLGAPHVAEGRVIVEAYRLDGSLALTSTVGAKPTVVSRWQEDDGTEHTITHDCSRFVSTEACLKQHAKDVKFAKTLWPPFS